MTNKPTEIELNNYLSAVKDEKEMCETMCNCTETDAQGEQPYPEIKYPTPRGGLNETPMLRKAARTNRLEYMDERRQEDLDNVHRRINSIEEQQSMFNTDLAARIRAIETILGIDD